MSEAATLIERFIGSTKRAARGLRTAGVCAALATSALALSGCASGPKPSAELVRASTLVSEAEKNEAQRYAAADLQRARDELSQAQTADSDRKYDEARSLAEKAAADADLASARTASGRARQSADEVRHSLDTLRQQLQQNPAPSGNTGPGQDRP